MSMYSPIDKAKRRRVWQKTKGYCWYCGRDLVWAASDPNRERIKDWFVVDHATPQIEGGTDELENLLPACQSCNCMKGSKDVEEFRNWLSTRDTSIPYFSKTQLEWLASQGFEMPKITRIIVFYGEEN